MRYKFEEEIKRFQKFQKGVLGIKENPKTEKEIDIRTYAKYLLREGSVIEKRELLRKEKKWAEADIVRERIKEEGYLVEDLPDGARVEKT